MAAAAFHWQWPEASDYAWFALMGGCGTLGHLCTAQAFREADATAVLPLDFTRLLWASLLGYFIFAEIPSIWTWTGGMVIFASAIYIAFREAKVKASRSAAGDEDA